MLWEYARSSHGEVNICGPCRDEILSEAGGADAIGRGLEKGEMPDNHS